MRVLDLQPPTCRPPSHYPSEMVAWSLKDSINQIPQDYHNVEVPHRPQSKGSIATRFTNCVMGQLPRWMCVFRGQVDRPGSLLRHGLSRVRFLKLSVVEGSRLDNMVRTTSCRGFEAALRAGLL
jgi:hypothetical protein